MLNRRLVISFTFMISIFAMPLLLLLAKYKSFGEQIILFIILSSSPSTKSLTSGICLINQNLSEYVMKFYMQLPLNWVLPR